jgi:hypothetical protein
LLEHIGPYPIRTSRERVTMEDAPVAFPNPRLALLQAPNKITSADFEAVANQVRGLLVPPANPLNTENEQEIAD